MKIVALSDTHSAHRQVRLPLGDVLLHAGDVTMRGQLSELTDFLDWFGRQPFRHKIFIGGNHDFILEKLPPAEIDALLPDGVTYLKDSGITVEGIVLWGTPVTPWYYNWAFNRLRGPAIAKHWAQIPENTNLLLTHGPAYGVLDVIQNGNHIGDKDLLQTILRIQPAVHVCGHVHEAYGRSRRGFTRFINASIMNEKYEVQNNALVFDI